MQLGTVIHILKMAATYFTTATSMVACFVAGALYLGQTYLIYQVRLCIDISYKSQRANI